LLIQRRFLLLIQILGFVVALNLILNWFKFEFYSSIWCSVLLLINLVVVLFFFFYLLIVG
jgi:hypothetical protein